MGIDKLSRYRFLGVLLGRTVYTVGWVTIRERLRILESEKCLRNSQSFPFGRLNTWTAFNGIARISYQNSGESNENSPE